MTETKKSPRPFAEDVEAMLGMRAKIELRKSMQRIRSTTPASGKHLRSEAIRTRLRELGIYRDLRSIALFRPIARKSEVDTGGIDEDARAAGLRVAYPILDNPILDILEIGDIGDIGGRDRDADEQAEGARMSFRWVDAPSEASFEDRGHGFPEPTSTERAEPSAIDLVIVPGLGFDPSGNRLGYGAGYYDRFLAEHAAVHAAAHAAARDASPHTPSTSPRTITSIGICFDFQVLVELPITAHDVPVSMVLTDVRTFIRG